LNPPSLLPCISLSLSLSLSEAPHVAPDFKGIIQMVEQSGGLFLNFLERLLDSANCRDAYARDGE
jgi:hypothetical protein